MHQHNYKKVKENNEGFVEVCIECKHRNSVRKDPKTGRIDNKKYLKEHARDTAQPTGRTSKIFSKYYGEAPKDLRYK
jgi:hypothetical protein